MTATNDHDQDNALPLDPETERCHRYEITAAMNAVIRTCHDIVTNHSHRGFWNATGDAHDAMALAVQADTTVLADLRMVLECADAITSHIQETHHQRHPLGE